MTKPIEAAEDALAGMKMGLGAWAWGDRVVWQFGRGYSAADVQAAFTAALSEGIRLFDTAEVYGSGRSEAFIGQFVAGTDVPVYVATKFFPWPWRLSTKSMVGALEGSLRRLGLPTVDLYQVHQPHSPMSVERLCEGLAACAELGLAREVGVSNFGQQQMLRAYTTLARRGIRLASNQVHFSLLHRRAEFDGLLARAHEFGARLIAHSPLEMGLLTGTYGRSHLPPGSRGLRYAALAGRIGPLLKLMTEVGQDHGGKSNAQVALNWVMSKGALPIPGAKNAAQAAENAGALGWSLTSDEVAALETSSDRVLEA